MYFHFFLEPLPRTYCRYFLKSLPKRGVISCSGLKRLHLAQAQVGIRKIVLSPPDVELILLKIDGSGGVNFYATPSAFTYNSNEVSSSIDPSLQTQDFPGIFQPPTDRIATFDEFQDQYENLQPAHSAEPIIHAPQPIITSLPTGADPTDAGQPVTHFNQRSSLSHQPNSQSYQSRDPHFPMQYTSQHKSSFTEEPRQSKPVVSKLPGSQVSINSSYWSIPANRYSISTSGTSSGTRTSTPSNPTDTMSRGRRQCHYCKQGFKDKSTRDRHEKGCEKNENRLLYTCPLPGCSYQIARRDNFRNHLHNMHKWDPQHILEEWKQLPLQNSPSAVQDAFNENKATSEEISTDAELSDRLSGCSIDEEEDKLRSKTKDSVRNQDLNSKKGWNKSR